MVKVIQRPRGARAVRGGLGFAWAPWAVALCAAFAPAHDAASTRELPQKRAVLEWVTPHRHKVGNVLAGRVIRHSFALANRSDGPVSIDAWETSSAVVQVAATVRAGDSEHPFHAPGELLPGDELALHVTVDTAGLLGPMSFSVGIETAEPLTLPPPRLSARILPLFRFDPFECDFGALRPDERPSRELVLTTPLDEPFHPRLDEASVPAEVQVDCEPVAPRADGRATTWKVRVTVAERPTTETFPAELRWTAVLAEHEDFRTADGTPRTQHAFGLTLQAQFKDWVFAAPRILDFGRCSPSCRREVRLRRTDSEFPLALEPDDFRFESTNRELDWSQAARVEISPIGTDEDRVNLIVQLTPPAALAAEARGVLVVRLGHPDLAELRIPLVTRP